jgi:Fe2+ transport system protein FeoA
MTAPTQSTPDVQPTIPLTQLRPGQTGVVCESKLSTSDAQLLRAMGLCDHATVRLCRAGEPCIVAVGGVRGLGPNPKDCTCGGSCRIGLARPLAERIFVTPLA